MVSSPLVTSKRVLVLRMRFLQDLCTKTIRGDPASGTFALLPRSPFIPQSVLRDVGQNGYGGECSRVKTHVHTFVLSLHVYVPEVLRGVLYPEAHINGLEKKKKRGTRQGTSDRVRRRL